MWAEDWKIGGGRVEPRGEASAAAGPQAVVRPIRLHASPSHLLSLSEVLRHAINPIGTTAGGRRKERWRSVFTKSSASPSG
ncbi:hypothetical protein BHE74_00042868 [Ensete ventricosum]|nr:hypothetical protein GW17_00001417 [Ensete ventricosum]RWW50840.1 hypothetical protein BHE74_00042868 [Ensete ventricosum]